MHMPETGRRRHFEGPIRLRHGPRDLLEVLRFAAAQQPSKFGKVERDFPVAGFLGHSGLRRGLRPLKPKPSYQATKDHGGSSAMTTENYRDVGRGPHCAKSRAPVLKAAGVSAG
jgi:hypothetical protein